MHIVILSGMNSKDTTACLKKNDLNVTIMPNQIQRVIKIFDSKRVTFWIMLNTRLTQHLLPFISYQSIVYMYDISQPLTLLRAHGWWKMMKEHQIKSVLWSMPGSSPTPAYNKMIDKMAAMFKLYDNSNVPHYTCKIKHIVKFLYAYISLRTGPRHCLTSFAYTCTTDNRCARR